MRSEWRWGSGDVTLRFFWVAEYFHGWDELRLMRLWDVRSRGAMELVGRVPIWVRSNLARGTTAQRKGLKWVGVLDDSVFHLLVGYN